LARIEKLAAGAKLRMAKRVEESNEWRRGGHRSPAEYLARKSGTSTGSAQAELTTSARLESLPSVEDAVRDGELSAVQAAAIADAAAADPGSEERLLKKAKRASVKDLRRSVPAPRPLLTRMARLGMSGCGGNGRCARSLIMRALRICMPAVPSTPWRR
jgi:hypothetical protein